MKNPCYNPETGRGCPARRPGCAVDCADWAEYVAERDKVYTQRLSAAELKLGISDISKNRMRKIQKRKLTDRRRGRK